MSKPPPFLRSQKAAVAWLKENLDRARLDEILNEYGPKYFSKRLAGSADSYVKFVKSAYREDKVELYRGVFVPSVDHVETENLGVCWSATRETAIPQFGSQWHTGRNITVVITGLVDPDDIDWELGFESFFMYGEGEWEIRLKSDVPVEVIRMSDYKTFDIWPEPPIKGNSGYSIGDEWGGSCRI